MTNRIALVLGVILVALIVLDLVLTGSQTLLFLGKRLMDLIEWMAFWR